MAINHLTAGFNKKRLVEDTHDYKDNQHILIKSPKITKTLFGVYGIIIKNGMILLVKKDCGPYAGLYDLPGGSQKEGENYSDTLKRVIMEEIGHNVTNAENERFKSIIFSDFTIQSGESGILQHNAVLYNVEISGGAGMTTDNNLSPAGAIWVDIEKLTEDNATPYVLIAANKPLIAMANENDEIISTHLRGTPPKHNRFVMISAVLLFNSRGNIIMQKIAKHKKWGGLWTYSAAGHVDAGENYEIAAKRELEEEMGIIAEIEREITAFPVMRDGRKTAYYHIFEAHSDGEIMPDENEVAEIREISLADLKKEINQFPEQFFNEFIIAVNGYFEQSGL